MCTIVNVCVCVCIEQWTYCTSETLKKLWIVIEIIFDMFMGCCFTSSACVSLLLSLAIYFCLLWVLVFDLCVHIFMFGFGFGFGNYGCQQNFRWNQFDAWMEKETTNSLNWNILLFLSRSLCLSFAKLKYFSLSVELFDSNRQDTTK